MTQDERNMLSDLANKIAQTPAPPRDPEAEEFIRKNIGARPDALYLMTQTVLIQNMALQQSQHQIQDLQQRAGQPVPASYAGGAGSFLGQNAPPAYNQGPYQPPSQAGYQAAGPQYASSSFAPPPSGMSSFLRGAAQTAAGVAAGTIAVQGIESLFSHHSGFGGSGLFGGGGIGGYGGGGETVIENNYYGDSGGERGSEHHGFTDTNDNPSVDLGPHADNFETQDVDDSNVNTDSGYDDNSSDDSSYSDSSDGDS